LFFLLLGLGAKVDIPDYGSKRTCMDEIKLKSPEFQKAFERLIPKKPPPSPNNTLKPDDPETLTPSSRAGVSSPKPPKQDFLSKIFGLKSKEIDKPKPIKEASIDKKKKQEEANQKRLKIEEEDRENELKKKET